jgi:hypothetical protein
VDACVGMPPSDTNDDGGNGQQYSYPLPIGHGLAIYLPPEQEITEAYLAAVHPGGHQCSQQLERRESLPRFSLGPAPPDKHQEEEECESAPAHRPVVNYYNAYEKEDIMCFINSTVIFSLSFMPFFLAPSPRDCVSFTLILSQSH